jgi:hypothetical protein
MEASLYLSDDYQSDKTYAWWKFLCLIAVFNMGIWGWVIYSYEAPHSTFYIQAILSGIYVSVCAFRSLFPRIDLERYCLHDSIFSSVALGRTCATIAEICFSIQCAIIIYSIALSIQSQWMLFIAYSIVPIIVIAQIFCWHATLTLNHFWHSMEEAAWVVMLVLIAGCFVSGFFLLSADYQVFMAIGLASCIISIWIMLFIDIPMYLSRAKERQHKGHRTLTIKAGLQDALSRREHTQSWGIWKQEVIWITSYFTFGVWLSISMMIVTF